MERDNLFNTPDLSCMTDDDKNYVYEPSEDSFLLLDALEKDYDLIKSIKPVFVIEVGCGSGVVSTFIAKLLKKSTYVMCTDINPQATALTKRMSHSNGCQVEPIISDLLLCFGDRIRNSIDILIFNPPYVVTPSSEVGANDLSASWAGGLDGREVLNRLLPNIGALLSDRGMCYLVAIKENNIDDITNILEQQDLVVKVILTRRSGPELLFILRISKCKEKKNSTRAG